MIEIWLAVALIGLGIGLMYAFNWLSERKARHLQLSAYGKAGYSAKQELAAQRAASENANGEELALAIGEALELHSQGIAPLEIFKKVAISHPSAVWFLAKKVLNGELDLGKLMGASKLIGGGNNAV